MAPPPSIQSFVPALEQSLLDSARPSPSPSFTSSQLASTSAPKFHSMTGQKRGLPEDEDDDGGDDEDEDEDTGGGGGGGKGKNPRKRNSTSTGRRKIEISYIDNKSKRHVSFTKRKAGLMKKAYELSTLTGTECLIVVVSETGLVYTYATPSLKAIVDQDRGREMIGLSLKGLLHDDPPAESNQGTQGMDLDVNSHLDHLGAGGLQGDVPVPSSSAARDYSDVFSLGIYPPQNQQPLANLSTDYSVGPASYSNAPGYSPIPASLITFAAQQQQQLASSSGSNQTPEASMTHLEAALSGHAEAYKQYQSQTSQGFAAGGSKHGVLEFGDAKNWKLPEDGRGIPTGVAGPSGNPAPGERAREAPMSSMDERRAVLRQQAIDAVLRMQEEPTIPNFIRAHKRQLLTMRPIPPPISDYDSYSLMLPGTETTLSLFGQMCAERAWTDPASLGTASQQFLESFLPSQNYERRMLHEARQHLALFFDYLEGHHLISPDVHMDLTSFSFAPASTASLSVLPSTSTEQRASAIESRLKTWVSSRGGGDERDEVVVGTFEVYRIRSNFVLLKPRRTDGGDQVEPMFKVRMPRDVTPQLKVDDVLGLSVRKVAHRSSWVPFQFTGIVPSSEVNDGAESDIDPEAYHAELGRLELLPESDETTEAFMLAKEVLGTLERARELLDEGELEEEDGEEGV